MVIRSPVRGLTPCRGPRSATLNFPKPVKLTSPPPVSTSVIPSSTVSTASLAAFLVSNCPAIRSTNSALVNVNPPNPLQGRLNLTAVSAPRLRGDACRLGRGLLLGGRAGPLASEPQEGRLDRGIAP